MASQSLLVAPDVYLKTGIHIGTKFKTKYMESFIYKTRPDGLSVLNVQKIDERIKLAANLLANYEPSDIVVCGRRETAYKPIAMFAKVTGAKGIAGRYPPGILTNPALAKFIEGKIIVISDPWPDRNAINDAIKVRIPIIALTDTNNQANSIDLMVPCNNKGKKSLGIVFYLLAREYMINRGMIASANDFAYSINDFTEE